MNTSTLRKKLTCYRVSLSLNLREMTDPYLSLSVPHFLSKEERTRLRAGGKVVRLFKRWSDAEAYYASIYGDEPAGTGSRSRWYAGAAKGWIPVYACLSTNFHMLDENS